jgi:hypothetical protein
VHELVLRRSNAIEHAHIRDVDYNPKKQNIIVSSVYLALRFLLSEEEHVSESPLCSSLEVYHALLFLLVTFQLCGVCFSCTSSK